MQKVIHYQTIIPSTVSIHNNITIPRGSTILNAVTIFGEKEKTSFRVYYQAPVNQDPELQTDIDIIFIGTGWKYSEEDTNEAIYLNTLQMNAWGSPLIFHVFYKNSKYKQ